MWNDAPDSSFNNTPLLRSRLLACFSWFESFVIYFFIRWNRLMKLKMEKEKSLQGASRFAFILVTPPPLPDLCVQELLIIIFSKTFVIIWKKNSDSFVFENTYILMTLAGLYYLFFFNWNKILNMHAVKITKKDGNLIHEALRVMENWDSLHFFLFHFSFHISKSFTFIFRGGGYIC